MQLRPAKMSDLAPILAIENQAFSHPWSETAILEELNRNPATLYVLKREKGGSILGYLCYWSAAGEIQLLTIAVHPDHRRRGLARFMMESLVQEARLQTAENIFLEVRPSNLPAINLYSHLGFQTIYRRPGYYQPENEDALVMQKPVLF
jgi:ribosomal-protein-alanine N-acetyltransferase